MINFDYRKYLKVNLYKGKQSMNFENAFKEMLGKLKNRAELEMLDNGYYRAINEHLQNTNKKYHCRSIAMTISQDKDDYTQHLLEISMLHPTMMIENKRPLFAGHKKDILEYLNKPNLLETMQKDLSQMSDKLKSC